jgi:hypothetical protein
LETSAALAILEQSRATILAREINGEESKQQSQAEFGEGAPVFLQLGVGIAKRRNAVSADKFHEIIVKPVILSDPADDPVLYTAADGEADVLCTRNTRHFASPPYGRIAKSMASV